VATVVVVAATVLDVEGGGVVVVKEGTASFPPEVQPP